MTREIKNIKPAILAPAGNRESFLAALAAGADAIYCGLKRFSARMTADNFSVEELGRLTRLAHERDTEVYVTFNSLIKPDELKKAGQLVSLLAHCVEPDALIVQDLAMVAIARQAGFPGQIHLSTLANVSFGAAVDTVKRLKDVHRVVLPRELSIDEIKSIADVCPEDLDLELFVHGALCYGVSGRCYWSSYLGGKSGLRGRCVQPCRRRYRRSEKMGRYFSCMDLSLDVLTKVIKDVPQVTTWKIEGRKKGPHYVYYAVSAYRMLRDKGHDPQAKRSALQLLDMALGRHTTHYNFLPQRPQHPVNSQKATGSGLQIGVVKGATASPWVNPKMALLPGDVLRIGYEDDPWHVVIRVPKSVPRGGRYHLSLKKGKKPRKNAPIFLVDRREPALVEAIQELEQALLEIAPVSDANPAFLTRTPRGIKPRGRPVDVEVLRRPANGKGHQNTGLWLNAESVGSKARSRPTVWWWLPPVMWPDDENRWRDLINQNIVNGARLFVLNSPWQYDLFRNPEMFQLWAGPFCNTANGIALAQLKQIGFDGAIVSPELGAEDVLQLPTQSALPLGVVIGGNWPLCISRISSDPEHIGRPFSSPRGEDAWEVAYDGNTWIYPNWRIDLTRYRDALVNAGYRMLVTLEEPVPKAVQFKDRPGLWNWKQKLE